MECRKFASNSIRGGEDRVVLYDIIKGIGIMLMVLGHTCGQPLYNWIYSFHMPLFFIVSGLFFSPNKYQFKAFVRKRFKQLVIPLFIFTTFIIGIASIFIPEQNIVGNLGRGILPGALWFLFVLFVVQVFYCLFIKCLKGNIWALLFIVFISVFAGSWLKICSYRTNFLYVGTIFSAFPFYALANLFGLNIIKIIHMQINNLKLWVLAAICLLFPLVVVLYTCRTMSLWYNEVPSPVMLYYMIACVWSFGIFFLSKAIESSNKHIVSILSFLGKNTLPIVALNQLIIDLSTKYISCDSHVCFKMLQQVLIWSICLLVIKFCNCHFRLAVGK